MIVNANTETRFKHEKPVIYMLSFELQGPQIYAFYRYFSFRVLNKQFFLLRIVFSLFMLLMLQKANAGFWLVTVESCVSVINAKIDINTSQIVQSQKIRNKLSLMHRKAGLLGIMEKKFMYNRSQYIITVGQFREIVHEEKSFENKKKLSLVSK